MTLPNAIPSILKDGKLKPGIYKIQNIYTETYLDIEVHSRGVCCRPASDLGEGRGFKWEIKSFGAGYTVQLVEPGKPDQFCTLRDAKLDGGSLLSVAAYPVAWRAEVVDDDIHRGFEYLRLYWGATKSTLHLNDGCKDNGAKVITWVEDKNRPWQIWKLIPESTPTPPSRSSPEMSGSSPLPSYSDGDTREFTSRAQHAESERDEFGTVVTEVTTTVVTTRKKYRVEDA